jgi:hypothetical protein
MSAPNPWPSRPELSPHFRTHQKLITAHMIRSETTALSRWRLCP